MRYQLPHILAKFCGFYCTLAGVLGFATFIFSAPFGLVLIIPFAIYGISCFRFNAETSKETMRYYMTYDLDKRVPKLVHSHSTQLRRRALILGVSSLLIIISTTLFGTFLLITVEPEYTLSGFPARRENIFFLVIPLFTITHGGQAIYCKMVYRSLKKKRPSSQ